MEEHQQPTGNTQPNHELPSPPPLSLFDLTPPEIKEYSYVLFYQQRHLDMINSVEQYSSSKEEVQAKCKTQFQSSQSTKIQSQSTGEKVYKNLQNCVKCYKCGHWIEANEIKIHDSFHVAFIVEGILLGDRHASASRKELFQRNKVTHILNAAAELKNHFQGEGVKYLKLDLGDSLGEYVIVEATKGANFIASALSEGGCVYVHCAVGKSRSVSCIIMYLMKFRRMSYEQSVELIRVNRPMANPNKSYVEQLKQYYLQNIK